MVLDAWTRRCDDSVAHGHCGHGGRGLFVPKPSRGADCQWCGMPDLGTAVRQRPLASAAGDGDSYSLRYSLARGMSHQRWWVVLRMAESVSMAEGPRS
jgi:hypothetical protein